MKKRTWVSVVVLIVSAGIFGAVWNMFRPEPYSGEKQLTIRVVHSDERVKDFEISTEKEYLGEALVEHGIVENNQSTYGLYILTADNETVNESKQEWWCLTKGGESLFVGASEIVIANGEVYELTFKTGYES